MTKRIDLTAAPGRRLHAALWVAGWAIYLLMSAAIVTAQSAVPFAPALLSSAIDHLPLALMSFAIWQVNRRLRGPALVAAHVVLAVFTIAVTKTAYFLYMRSVMPPEVFRYVFNSTWLYQLLTTALEYCTLAGSILLVQARQRGREREAAAREAELAAARAQLHPHFILNSLNSIVSLIDSDPARAREMVVGLSQLLHASFRGIDEEMVPLEREIEMTRAYLAIEQIRFGSRLRVVIDAGDDVRALAVPPLVLQPLVENAVRHGIAPHARGGEVRIRAQRNGNDRLLLEVSDSGNGADDDALRGGGRGLALTRRRLESVYRDGYALSFDRAPDGFAVRLDLPAETHG